MRIRYRLLQDQVLGIVYCVWWIGYWVLGIEDHYFATSSSFPFLHTRFPLNTILASRSAATRADEGTNHIPYPMRADTLDANSEADSPEDTDREPHVQIQIATITLRSDPIKQFPYCQVAEQHMEEVEICVLNPGVSKDRSDCDRA